MTIHNSSLQVMSSFTTVLTILATISKTASYVPFLAGKESVIALAGYYAYYALVTREDNGTVKKSVNAGIIGGILWNKITTGALNFGSIGAVLSMSSVHMLIDQGLVRKRLTGIVRKIRLSKLLVLFLLARNLLYL